MPDNLFEPVAQRLLDCFTARLHDDLPAAQIPARIGFRFDADDPTMGIAVNEDECKCGTAWVRVVNWQITSNGSFPGPDETIEGHRCPAAWLLDLEMGIGRCPPIGNERDLETVAERNAFHVQMLDDAAVMRRSIFCCFNQFDPTEIFNVGAPRRIGPAGSCMQQVLPITVMVVDCDECQPVP